MMGVVKAASDLAEAEDAVRACEAAAVRAARHRESMQGAFNDARAAFNDAHAALVAVTPKVKKEG